MQNLSTRTLITYGTAFAMALLVSAVWTAGVSVSTGLGMTALLVLASVVLVAVARGVCDREPDADSAQRERMRAQVP